MGEKNKEIEELRDTIGRLEHTVDRRDIEIKELKRVINLLKEDSNYEESERDVAYLLILLHLKQFYLLRDL